MEEIKGMLMTEAKAQGICAGGYEDMRNRDIDGLVDYYLANPDWCMERGYPTLEVLREHFSHIEDKGVFVDKTFTGELLDEKQVYIFHNCKGTVKVGLNMENGIIPMLYVGNKCRLRIIGTGTTIPVRRSEVPVYIFGKNDVSANDNRYVKFIRYKSDLI